MSEKYVEIGGKIVALSHIFNLVEQPLFILEVDTNERIEFILFGKEHFLGHSHIEPGAVCHISHLRKAVYKDIHILKASRHSEINLIGERQCQVLPTVINEDQSGFVSFEGIITTVVDDEVGIYELGENVSLILSYLKDLVVGLPGCSAKAQSPKNWLTTVINFENSLQVGDKLRIFNAHLLPGKDGNVNLVCCGRSLVRCERLSELSLISVCDGGLSESGLLHCLHNYNFGLRFLRWLRDIQHFLISFLAEDKEVSNRITRRKWNGVKGILCQWVEELLQNAEPESRSFLQEFLNKEHVCFVEKEFEEVLPLKICEISSVLLPLKNEKEEKEEEEEGRLWNHFVIRKKEHNRFLVGFLKRSRAGNLRLEYVDQIIEVVVVGRKCNTFLKIGRVVAVSNFEYVEERFNIHEMGEVTRRYIVVHSKYITCLETGLVPCIAKPSYNAVTFSLRVTSISALNFFVHDLKRDCLNSFFIAKAFICQKGPGVNYANEEAQEKLIRFSGSFSSLYPFLREPCIINGRMPLKAHSDVDFQKDYDFAWLSPMSSCFRSTRCVDVPQDLEVLSIQTVDVPDAIDVIPSILEGCSRASIVNIKGRIVEKIFMTPKFKTQKVQVPIRFVRLGAGAPGSKVTRILVDDVKFPGNKIWVYLSKFSSTYVSQYPLGVVPGAEVNITWLERVVSDKRSVYLTSTIFTRIIVNSVNVPKDLTRPAKLQFISELSQLPPGNVCLIVASLSHILKVSLKRVCPVCESDFENEVCSYAGCHAKAEGVMAASSRILVDDGSGTATVFLNDVDQVRAMLNINSKCWEALTEMVKTRSLNYSLKNSKRRSSQANLVERAFSSLIEDSQNFGPLKILGRIFPQESSLATVSLDLFGIEMEPIVPKRDHIIFEQNIVS